LLVSKPSKVVTLCDLHADLTEGLLAEETMWLLECLRLVLSRLALLCRSAENTEAGAAAGRCDGLAKVVFIAKRVAIHIKIASVGGVCGTIRRNTLTVVFVRLVDFTTVDVQLLVLLAALPRELTWR